MLDELIKKVAVIGAAGKMGGGISLLLLQEMAKKELESSGKVGSGDYCLYLIDKNEKGLFELKKSLSNNLLKFAEKNINFIRKGYEKNSNLISNEEIIRAFVDGAGDIVRLHNHLDGANNADLVFEAVIEDLSAKEEVFNTLKNGKKYFFTNTSSIPIKLLNETCKLDNKIIGFHFYNPPPVQKLIEFIAPKQIDKQLYEISTELAKRLQKKIIPSNDIAGFIGNGHFMREVIYALKLTKKLAAEKKIALTDAIYIINLISQEYLLRPMGIFQLIDYVGIDVVQNILKIMSKYLPDPNLHDDIIDDMVRKGVKGGQNVDGSQKKGFFEYDKHTISGSYSLEENKYLKNDIIRDRNAHFFRFKPSLNWKSLVHDKNKEPKIADYIIELFSSDLEDAKLAQEYLKESKKIALKLVKDGVANKIEDVNAVLENGFFHAYGVGTLKIPGND